VVVPVPGAALASDPRVTTAEVTGAALATAGVKVHCRYWVATGANQVEPPLVVSRR
jgi:hypothetical protein